MGSLLSLLNLHRNATLKRDIFVDFENAQPTESEQITYEIVDNVLNDAEKILTDLKTYKGASMEIRQAIDNPHDKELQIKTWNIVVPLVNRLKSFYEFALRLDETVMLLLSELCSDSMPPLKHLETQQALVKQFSCLLDFVLKFDELKMLNPSIQNDFSFYRRTVNRIRSPNPNHINNNSIMAIEDLSPEFANRMSLFYANATPMLHSLANATLNFVTSNSHLPNENITETLGTMAKVCQRMIENQDFCSRFQNEETVYFVLRVMVGVIILYDHVHPIGAFAKQTTQIDVRGSIKVLKEQPPTMVEGLLNSLRYTTRHLNDETTPKNIKNMLAA